MNQPLLQSAFLPSFECLGADCPDTCCKGWNMQVDAGTQARWAQQAPELLSTIEGEGGSCRMKRDERSGYCVKFASGLCGIHKEYGADFLGDACYAYPRITRKLGAQTLMTAGLSCPEVARLALLGEHGMAIVEGEAARLPQEIKDYLPGGMTPQDALAVHAAFLDAAGAEGITAEAAMARIISVAHSFTRLPPAQWPEAAAFYLASTTPLTAPEPTPDDPFNLLHALAGLIVSTRTPRGERLSVTLDAMQSALACPVDWAAVKILPREHSASRSRRVREAWQARAPAFEPVLKRWLQLELAGSLFPFAGLGASPAERITILGVRFATLRLGLMCEPAPTPEAAVRIAQSLARVFDHLGDAAFSLQIYAEAGWTRERRLRGLLE